MEEMYIHGSTRFRLKKIQSLSNQSIPYVCCHLVKLHFAVFPLADWFECVYTAVMWLDGVAQDVKMKSNSPKTAQSPDKEQ